jgi:preprotein translocase subunit SecG
MIIVVTIVHVLVSLILIAVVLLQTGKRADLAGAFGGGGSQTAFGPRGAANMLTKLTTWSAILFMFTSLSLAVLSSRSSGSEASVLDGLEPGAAVTEPVEDTAPAGPLDDGTQGVLTPVEDAPVEPETNDDN